MRETATPGDSPMRETTTQGDSPMRETTTQGDSPMRETTTQRDSPMRETTTQGDGPMRETYHPQPLRPSSLRITTLTHVIPAPIHVIPVPIHVILAKAGIHPAASNCRRTAPIQPSTEIDTIRQSPTNHNENSCPRVTHARVRGNGHPPSRHSHTHSRHSRTHPRHSRTHPRHSREGGNPPRCVQLPKDSTLPAVDGNRHNPTESDEPQRKLVPAREATAFHLILLAWLAPRTQQVGLSSIPVPIPSFPRMETFE